MTTFYQRYVDGETETVYNDIYALGEDAFSAEYLPDIEKVLVATFKRAASNFDILFKELKKINYHFKVVFKYNFEKPLHPPLNNTDTLLKQLDAAVILAGYIPLSLKYFYKFVGGVNFAWDYETNENIRWELADPIQIASLDDVVSEVTRSDWQEMMQEYLDEEEEVGLELAADDYHKDNISGGSPYSLQLTKKPSIDGLFLNEPNSTSFINYLRMCFAHCGFPGIENPKDYDGFQAFSDEVKPQLQKI